jgi:serine/threonine protein kinase
VELIGPLRDFVKKRWEDTLGASMLDVTSTTVEPILEGASEESEDVSSSEGHASSRYTRPSTHATTATPRDSSSYADVSDTDDDVTNPDGDERSFLKVFAEDGTLDRLRRGSARSTGESSASSLGSDVPALAPLGPAKPPNDSDSAVRQALLDAKKRFSEKLVGNGSSYIGGGALELQRHLSTTRQEDTNKISSKGTLADTFAHLESQAGTNGMGSLDKPWVKCEPIRPDLSFGDLKPVRALGKGHFGKVYLVLSRNATEPTEEAKQRLGRWAEPTREAFALKCLSRYYITSNGWQTLVENERAAMLELTKFCDSPFLLKMYNTYSDSRNLYLLMELCTGGDMYAALKSQRKQRFADHNSVKFYSACAITGLAAMHARNIIYRDLKPENMLLGADGYVKLGDFGLAKKSIKTFTVAGTPDYMAPETILSRGHDTAVDYWALGILIYELIFGVTPFYGEEPMDIYERILAHENEDDLKFPDEDLIGEHGASICRKLLHPKRTRRLGNILSGVSGVMFHPFFKEFDWNSLQNKRMKPPHVPGELDLSEYNSEMSNGGVKNSFVADFESNEEDYSGWDPGY